ncbi:MAG: dTDP-4-dehydrorhamnose 3,5-epimerase [Clostridia bacterium]|nr:dTDP-4-dehydrorhamnose 3,5-epimerase [Clostridia bacterium]
MKRLDTNIPGVYIIEPQIFGDHRGYFMETYNQAAFEALGIRTVFVQDNQSFTEKYGTIRGIHFQNSPMSQAKLVRVTRGVVLDVAVDLRRGSPTYLKWTAEVLSEDNRRMLFIPRGFGHGFKTLSDNVEFVYKVDTLFSKENDRGIRFDDPAIGVDWGEVIRENLSEKDLSSPFLADSDCNYVYDQEAEQR